MNITLSLVTMGQVLIFIVVSIVIAFITLAPINDQPMMKSQKITCGVLITIAFLLIFKIVTFSVS